MLDIWEFDWGEVSSRSAVGSVEARDSRCQKMKFAVHEYLEIEDMRSTSLPDSLLLPRTSNDDDQVALAAQEDS